LSAALNQPGTSVYVGRNTSGGCRDFYFYTRTANDWNYRVETAITNFAEYGFETGSRPDPDWTTYLTFLYPSGEAMQRIQNRRVCDNLQKKGDSLTKVREIDHWFYFPSTRSRAAFISRVSKDGFAVREFHEHPESKQRFGVQFYRVDLPSFDQIDAITLPLYQAAKDAGGDYDGWETQVMVASEN
jgi:hypothetical protein